MLRLHNPVLQAAIAATFGRPAIDRPLASALRPRVFICPLGATPHLHFVFDDTQRAPVCERVDLSQQGSAP